MKNLSRTDKMVLFLLLFLLISVIVVTIANKFPKTLFNRASERKGSSIIRRPSPSSQLRTKPTAKPNPGGTGGYKYRRRW